MCGIIGSYGKKVGLSKGMKAMTHRGEIMGEASSPNSSLGHIRLAIIDLDSRSDQPLVRGDNAIVFNGEIYNYKNLRGQLEAKGYEFETESDTEVILVAYEVWGRTCVEKFIGTWAFAIATPKDIFLSRDRIGEKPLYYHVKKGVLYFASELPALLKIVDIEKNICKEALGLYFTHNIRHMAGMNTIYEDVFKLMPGSNLYCDGSIIKQERYWRPDFTKNELPGNYPLVLSAAVNRTCVSDVPVGLLLSGGVDSTNIAIAMANPDIMTYTIGFDENDPELERARKVAEHLGMKNKQIIFSDQKYIEEGLKVFRKLTKQLGEPINLIQPVFTYMIAREVSKDGIKVLIGGNGADELFYGYDGAKMARLAGWMPNYKPFLYRKWSNLPKRIDRLCNSKEFIDRAQWMGLAIENEHSITIVNDLGGMAATVEIRAPFLDYEMISYAHRLPTKYKVKAFGENKIIMRDYIREEIGPSFVYKDKMGFGHNIKLSGLIREEWKDEIKRGIDYAKKVKGVKFKHFDELYDEHMKGEADNSKEIFGVYAFAVWHEEFMKDG